MSALKSIWLLVFCWALALPLATTAADPAEPDAGTEAKAEQPISAGQLAAAHRYERFEKSLYQLYEYMRRTDPDRADLLERAFKKSREDQIVINMRQLVELLQQEEFGDAVGQQDQLLTHLGALLNLLQSEDRMSELEKEQARIEALLKDVNRTIGQEKAVQASTQRGQDTDRLAQRQKDVADETQKIVDKIDQQDGAQPGKSGKPGQPGEKSPGDKEPGDKEPGDKEPGDKEPGESKPGESKPGESEPGESKPGESKPGESKPGESKPGESKPGESKPGESKPGESKPGESKPGESKPGESKPGESKPGESKPGDDSAEKKKTPGRDELEQAHREMERAIEELKKKNRDGASESQDEALQKLIAAKEKLEEILRQLREEELELVLAALEARFQKMLSMQIIVLNGTVNLAKTSEAERESSRYTGRALELARLEADIALEADKALTILKAEGTSVAFPIAVEDLRSDILVIVQRLEDRKVGDLTQAIERDIVEALQEMVEALQKEMEKEQKDGKPCDCEGKPVLVDKLAELKMLRTLQKRVNRRTRTLGRLIEGEQTENREILDQLQVLAQRQARIVKTAHDITKTRNE